MTTTMSDIGEYAGTPPPKVPPGNPGPPTWNAKDNPGQNPWTKEPWGAAWKDSESTVDPMSRSKEPLRLGKQYPICDCPSCVRVRAERDLDQGKPAGWSDYVPSKPAKESFDSVLKRLYPDVEFLADRPLWKVDPSALVVIEVIERLSVALIALDNAGIQGSGPTRTKLLGVLDEAVDALVDLTIEDSL
jgi:hypothetical protein